MGDPRVVVVGATGAVGKKTLEVLWDVDFALSSLRVTASARSVGEHVDFGDGQVEVEATTPSVFDDCDIAFIAVNDEVSRTMAAAARSRRCVAIDKSGYWRLDPTVPLVVPEVNADDLEDHKGIVATPNCSTTPLVMVMDALRKRCRIERVIAATYQSVSGTGAAAMKELEGQSDQVLRGKRISPDQYPHQIAFNLLPHIGSFDEDGFASEETKMEKETRKMLGDDTLLVSATCVRVPVLVGHSEAVNIELSQDIEVAEARELLDSYSGIKVVDDVETFRYPMPVHCEGTDEVLVGRIRKDRAFKHGLAMWLSADNLRKGAATNAVQIAQELVRRNLWGKESAVWPQETRTRLNEAA